MIFLISYCHYHSLAVIIVYILYFFVLSYADVQSNSVIIYENILYSFLIEKNKIYSLHLQAVLESFFIPIITFIQLIKKEWSHTIRCCQLLSCV